MMRPEWRRICGLHIQDDGEMAAVWMALDKETDCIHLYDACIFRNEVLAVITEGLNARGRWIPIAWEESAKDMMNSLLDRGCNMLPEAVKETDARAEVTSRDIWERQRSKRFKVDKRLGEWLDEYKTFYRQEAKIPREGYPLMSATRHAMAQLSYARRQAAGRSQSKNFPKVAMI